jgi:PPE-repeat protein
MTSNVVNQVPYLRTSRSFPQEAQPLAVEVNRSYVDVAEKVNDRIIGVYPTNRSAVNGESWFITNRKQQAFRQIYSFTATGNIAHGITWTSVSFISPNSYGTFTDGTNWYGVPYLGSTAVTAEVSFYVTSTNIVVVAGAGAPSITQGYINLEWVSQV